MGKFFHDFLLLFCEKNSDGTKHLRLRGRELFQRIGRRVNADDMPDIVDFLRKHPEVISLDLSYNDFGDIGLTILSQQYFNHRNDMRNLNLMQCDITAPGLFSLSSSRCLQLKSCRLNGNKLGCLGARYIARLIEYCPSLEAIDFAETDQTLESIESILIIIEQCKLKSLDISRIIPNSYYASFNSSALADNLSVLLKLNENLRELYIRKCGFDGHDVRILLSGLTVNKHIELLDLSCNNIADLGIEVIAEWLKTRPPLRGLNVSCNKIGSYGARALSFGLPFSKVRYLDITNNKIADWGLTDLLDSLKKPCQMRIIYLWGNELGPVSCQRMSRMLESGVLKQEYIDVKMYSVDGELHAAYYPTNHFKQKYYCEMEYGSPPELKIKRNKVYPSNALPRELLNFCNVDRYPPVDESLGLERKKVKDCGDVGEDVKGKYRSREQ